VSGFEKEEKDMPRKSLLLVLFILLSMSCSVGCSHSRHSLFESIGVTETSMDHLFSNYFQEASMLRYVDGELVHYCDQGHGPALLLLHGLTASLHTWNGWVEELKNKYRMIRLDILGFGLTGPSKTKTYSRNNWVQFIDKFVTILELDHFSIAGNSLGGYIAWNYALDYPQKVNKLILIDPVGYPQETPFLLNLACFPGVGEIGKVMMPRLMIKMGLKDVYGDKTRVAEDLVDLYFDMSRRPGAREAYVDIFRHVKAASRWKNVGDRIKYISKPTMLMWGEKDRWVPVDLLKRWVHDMPHAVVRRYPGLGHVPMEEQPRVTAKDADQFLSSQLLTAE